MKHDQNGPEYLYPDKNAHILTHRTIVQICPSQASARALFSDAAAPGGYHREDVACWGLWDEWDEELSDQGRMRTGRRSSLRRRAGALIVSDGGLEPADATGNFEEIVFDDGIERIRASAMDDVVEYLRSVCSSIPSAEQRAEAKRLIDACDTFRDASNGAFKQRGT